jgi:hypothetical protein
METTPSRTAMGLRLEPWRIEFLKKRRRETRLDLASLERSLRLGRAEVVLESRLLSSRHDDASCAAA